MKIYRQLYRIGYIILLVITPLLFADSRVFKVVEAAPQTFNAQLEYLKSIHSSGPVSEPQLIFALALQYLNTNQFEDGIGFFGAFLKDNDPLLSPNQKAFYLSALGLLRGSFADHVPLLRRIDWVNETIDIMETARELTDNKEFLVRWSTGIFYSQIPEFFKKNDTALEDLTWCIENISSAPHRGWLREVYFHLGLIFHKANDEEQAQEFLKLSGYDSFDKQIILTTPYATNAAKGSTFHPKRLKEIIPGKIFVLSGFEFAEFYFIVSQDGMELIAIDAGTRPDSAMLAYEFLKEQFPALPELTTVFVTHSHWDHIGGHRFFKELNPGVTFYARENFFTELELDINVPVNFDFFFGTDFKIEFLTDFMPDKTIAEQTKVEIGGTLFELIPISGGETRDGMFIHLPEYSVLFTGDFIMPYIGAPILEEGSVQGLFQAIDLIVILNPRHILHGHEVLTRIFNTPTLLANLKRNLEWLHQETLNAIHDGEDRASIHHKNLIPPFLNENPEVQLAYFVLRENLINRIYDQNVGYWQPDLQGLDHLSQKEFGAALVHYLGLSEEQLTNAVEKMVDNGDHELAGWLVRSALTQFPNSETLKKEQQNTFLKLKEKYQEFDPFKFIIYSEIINDETQQLE